IQKAYFRKEVDFPKPISCHLFPIRVSNHGVGDVLNYEEISICKPAVDSGKRQGFFLADFLKEPLTRKFGAEWYESFQEVCKERAALLADGRRLEAETKRKRKR
ncbi:MAG: DUF3109 family protein, partial [Rhodothermales bacterium]|nr:DUF3109 family protein [Rhodothermales bacterium]